MSPPLPLRDILPAWRTILENSGWLLAEKALRWVVGLTVGVWTARYLAPSGFGTLNYALSYVALFGGAVTLGIDYLGVRELVRAPGIRAEILGTILGLRLASGLVLAAAAAGSALALGHNGTSWALVGVLSLTLLLNCGDVFDLWFQAELRARRAATARTLVLLIAAGGRITLILLHAPLEAFAWLIVAEAGLASAALAIAFRHGGGQTRGWCFSLIRAKGLLAESWPNIVSNLAVIAYMRIDRIMLGEIRDTGEVGIYSAAATLVEIWYVVPLAVVASATPMITRQYLEDPDEYLSQIARLVRFLAVLSWLLVAAMGLSSWWLVPRLYGSTYAGTGQVLTVLSIGMPFSFLGVAVSPWYLNERLFVVAMWRHLAGVALNLGLNLLLIPRWGALGAAGATVFAFAVTHVFANAVSPRTRPLFRLQWRALLLLSPKVHP